MGSRAGLDRCGKSRNHRDSIPGPSSPWPVAIPTTLSRPSYFDCTRGFQNCCCRVSFMSGRGGVRAGEGPKDTENMKMMSLLEKVEMLGKLDR